MDAVLGHRPTTRPSVVLYTSEQPNKDDEGGSEEGGEEDKVSKEQSDLHLEDAWSSHAYHLLQAHLLKVLSLQPLKGRKETYQR